MKKLPQNKIIFKAIEFSQGNTDDVVIGKINKTLSRGFWETIDLYSNKIKIESISMFMDSDAMWKALQKGKALITENVLITYKYGGPLIDGKNIYVKELKKYEGKVAVIW